MTYIQTIEPVNPYTEKQILKGLQEGKFFTSIGGTEVGFWDDENTWQGVGIIVDQDYEDAEFSGFEEV